MKKEKRLVFIPRIILIFPCSTYIWAVIKMVAFSSETMVPISDIYGVTEQSKIIIHSHCRLYL